MSDNQSTSILAFSDIHDDQKSIVAIKNQIMAADLVVVAGDLTTNGREKHAAALIGIIKEMNRNILAVSGNMDDREINDYLALENISLNGQSKEFGKISLSGISGSNKTPLFTPQEYTEEYLANMLEDGFAEIRSSPYKILVSHVPPHGYLDRTYFLVRGGSKAVRDFIEKNDIHLCICGHIHEGKGIVPFSKGKTIVNCGRLSAGFYAQITVQIQHNQPLSSEISLRNFKKGHAIITSFTEHFA